MGLPFAQGEAVQVIQGYNGGTHQDASRFGLDLVLASGETSGAPVFSPLDGTVPWAFAPGEKTGRIEILASDKQYGAMLCHVILDRPHTSHVHMELHAGGRGNDIVPFSASQGGVPLEGWDLPATGASNDHAGEGPIVLSTPGSMS